MVVLFLFLTAFFFLWTKVLWKTFACNVAGSYECVQTWNFKVTETNLIKIIQEIKNEHPELKVPNDVDPSFERYEYWCKFTFYYKDTNQDIFTWSRPNEDSLYTTFALIAVSTHIDSLTPYDKIILDRKEINRDYEYFENRKEIEKFEGRIINLIEEKIKER